MIQNECNPHRDQEQITGNLGRKEVTDDPGNYFRILRAAMRYPTWEAAEPVVRFGTLARRVLILAGFGALTVEAIIRILGP
jgi:hypothetical protein